MPKPLTPAKRQSRAGSVKRRGTPARFNVANAIYRVEAKHLTDLARQMGALGRVLRASESPDVITVGPMISVLRADPNYEAIRPIFDQIEAQIRAKDSIRASEPTIDVINAVWQRSDEREVSPDAFFRRIRP